MNTGFRALMPAAALCGFALVACRPAPEAAPPAAASPSPAASSAAAETEPQEATAPPLAGTRWRLVEIQSMDDAIGTTRPDDPSLYTLAFEGDGHVAMRLNCNRGTGSWTATPAADGDSGNLAIGPLALTQAICPPPSLDERIARDMAYVRGYLLREAALALSLEADAAIYLWEPDPGAEGEAARPPAD